MFFLGPLKLLTGVCRIMEQEEVMRSHLIYKGMLLNEIDLFCVNSDSSPDLSQLENMKTYSFNYSGQLYFLKNEFCSLLFSFSNIIAKLVCVNKWETNTIV